MSARQERLGLYNRFEPDFISVSLYVQQFGLRSCIEKCPQSLAHAITVACRPDDDQMVIPALEISNSTATWNQFCEPLKKQGLLRAAERPDQ
jgi:hypothetical protein